jgi:hypothetical protein
MITYPMIIGGKQSTEWKKTAPDRPIQLFGRVHRVNSRRVAPQFSQPTERGMVVNRSQSPQFLIKPHALRRRRRPPRT